MAVGGRDKGWYKPDCHTVGNGSGVERILYGRCVVLLHANGGRRAAIKGLVPKYNIFVLEQDWCYPFRHHRLEGNRAADVFVGDIFPLDNPLSVWDRPGHGMVNGSGDII